MRGGIRGILKRGVSYGILHLESSQLTLIKSLTTGLNYITLTENYQQN